MTAFNQSLTDNIAVNDGNMIRNGNCEIQPPFTAPQTAYDAWIDGTAGGSTNNNKYGWKQVRASIGTGSSSFQYTNYIGKPCINIFTNALAHDGTTTSIIGVGQSAYPGATLAASEKMYLIPVVANTQYKFSCDHFVTQIDPNITFRGYVTFYDSGLNRITGSNFNATTVADTQWTNTQTTITPPTNAVFAQVSMFFSNIANSNPLSVGGNAYFTNVNAYPIKAVSTPYLTKALLWIRNDTITLVDTIKRVLTKSGFTDIINIADTIVKTGGKTFIETYTILDVFVRRIYPYLDRIKVYTKKLSPFKRFPKK